MPSAVCIFDIFKLDVLLLADTQVNTGWYHDAVLEEMSDKASEGFKLFGQGSNLAASTCLRRALALSSVMLYRMTISTTEIQHQMLEVARLFEQALNR